VIHTRGRSSGIETDQRAGGLAAARDEKLYRLAFFTDLPQARAVAADPAKESQA
jgi:hypothetical protein